MKTLKRFFTACFSAVLLSGCCSEHPCQQSFLSIQLAGFDSTEIDTVIIRRYGSAVTPATAPLIDTFIGNAVRCEGDTTCLYPVVNGVSNFEIYIPAIARTVHIDSFVYDNHTSQKVCGISQKIAECFNQIIAYRADGQTIAIPFGTHFPRHVILK